MLVSRRASFRPDQMLLAGVAINTIFAALLTTLLGSGDPRLYGLLQWIAGSTVLVTPVQAVAAVVTALLALLIIPLATRWLHILPLGGPAARSMGLNLTTSRMTLLVLAALTAASGTLLVGPLSFVGLMAPHMARALGFRQPISSLAGSALLGAIVMTLADWIARVALFPNQLPVGLVATLIGGPFFLVLVRRRSA
jgi:iron complex transport system permease protein